MSTVSQPGTENKKKSTGISALPPQTLQEIAKHVHMEDLPSFNKTFHKLSDKQLTPVSQIRTLNDSQMTNQIFNNALVKQLQVDYTLYDFKSYKSQKASVWVKRAELYNYKLAVYIKTWPNMFRFLFTIIEKLPMEYVTLPPPLENNIEFSYGIFKGGIYNPTIIFSVTPSTVGFSVSKTFADQSGYRHGFRSPLGVNLQDNPDPVTYLPNVILTFLSLIMFMDSKSDLTDNTFTGYHIELNTPYLHRGLPDWTGNYETEIEYNNEILTDFGDEKILTKLYKKPIRLLNEGGSRQYTKSNEKHTHNNRVYVVYHGSRGGRYIKVNGTYRYLSRKSDK